MSRYGGPEAKKAIAKEATGINKNATG